MAKIKKTKKQDTWFKDHPVTSMILFWVVNIVLLELLLRAMNPSILEFAHQARQVHEYSPRLKADLAPNSVAHMKLTAPDGQLLYNFLITTGPDGFRTYDRPIDNNHTSWSRETSQDGQEDRRLIHAVGDSFTMGWGVDYSSSYPGVLDWLLPPEYRVLNLGMDGFGVIAATEKSMDLWGRYPANFAIYLFHPNDMSDDEKLVAYRQKGPGFHFLYAFYDILRRDTYLAGIPTAARWHNYFGKARTDTTVVSNKRESVHLADYDDLIFEVNDLSIKINDKMHPSFRQISRYAEFVAAQGAQLVVYIFSNADPSLAFYQYCIDNGIEAHLFDVPEEMLLIRDGHFNHTGSYVFANHVRDRILSE